MRTAGICAVCGEHADRRYGGEGRYLTMCLDCWLADETAVRTGTESWLNANTRGPGENDAAA